MAYRKFDDPSLSGQQAGRKVYDAEMKEAVRRALQGITNRVIGGTNGTTSQKPVTAGLGDGGTGGIKINYALTAAVNGKLSYIPIQDNLVMPSPSATFTGFQGTNTCAMYLVSATGGSATSGTISGPGNIIDKGAYATIALAAAQMKIPDLPDGHVALGYAVFNTPTAGTAIQVNACGLLSTAGTVAYTELTCMPYDL